MTPIPLPTKTLPDWMAVADHVVQHGPCLLADDPRIKYNPAHASLHRRGMGIYKHPQGWVVTPLEKRT